MERSDSDPSDLHETDPPESFDYVHHVDGDPRDNDLDNLEVRSTEAPPYVPFAEYLAGGGTLDADGLPADRQRWLL